MRLLVDPVKRMYEIKAEEEAAEKEREAKQNSKVNMLLQQKGQLGQKVIVMDIGIRGRCLQWLCRQKKVI